MNQPLSTVYGVISFYSLFSLKPKGRHNIRVCTGTACYVRGVREVLDRVERRFGVKAGGTCEDGRFSLAPWPLVARYFSPRVYSRQPYCLRIG